MRSQAYRLVHYLKLAINFLKADKQRMSFESGNWLSLNILFEILGLREQRILVRTQQHQELWLSSDRQKQNLRGKRKNTKKEKYIHLSISIDTSIYLSI